MRYFQNNIYFIILGQNNKNSPWVKNFKTLSISPYIPVKIFQT